MTRAPHVPSLPSAGAPVSVLVDYDGTVSRQDVGDLLLKRHVADQALVGKMDRAYDDGLLGSRDMIRWDMKVLPRDAELLRTEAAVIPQDDTFPAFVRAVRAAGALVEIVSDGLGFYVASNLALLDPALDDLAVATNANEVSTAPTGWDFRTATRPVSSAGPASASGCGFTVRAVGRWSSSATARATGTLPTTRTSSLPRTPCSPGGGRRAGISARGSGSARSSRGSRRPSETVASRRRTRTCRRGGRPIGPKYPGSSAAPRPGARGGQSPARRRTSRKRADGRRLGGDTGPPGDRTESTSFSVPGLLGTRRPGQAGAPSTRTRAGDPATGNPATGDPSTPTGDPVPRRPGPAAP